MAGATTLANLTLRTMKRLLLCIALAFLLPLNIASAKRSKRIDSGEKITAVSGSSITVKAGSAPQIFKISGNTVIHLDGRKVTAKDLHKGMHAQVTPSQLDPTTASAIEASDGH